MALRDIRPDLKERLDAAQKTASELSGFLENLNSRIDEAKKTATYLENLLRIEEERIRKELANSRPQQSPAIPIGEFLLKEISQCAHTKDELREAAYREGYFGPDDSGGRTIHTTLLNMVNSGKIVKDAEERYRLGRPLTPEETSRPRGPFGG